MLNHKKCVLISIEGIGGSGKTTHSLLLEQYLRKESLQVKRIHFPNPDHVAGKLIVATLRGEITIPLHAFFVLFTANRLESRPDIIDNISTLNAIIFDRYTESEIAYGLRASLPGDWLTALELQMPSANLVILLDVDPQLALERLAQRSTQPTLTESLESLIKLREIYHSLAESNRFPGQHWMIVDTSDSIDIVQERINRLVVEYIQQVTVISKPSGEPNE